MSEISSEKIRALLNDPKNIELIAGIAGSMGAAKGETVQKTQAPVLPEKEMSAVETVKNEITESRNTETMAGGFGDLGGILSSSSFSSDPRIALLSAIKPYINEHKKERVDGLVKAIQVAGILNTYKNGLFGIK